MKTENSKNPTLVKPFARFPIYEIYCDFAAECVYMVRKPTLKDLDEIRKQYWPKGDYHGRPVELKVEKLKCKKGKVWS